MDKQVNKTINETRCFIFRKNDYIYIKIMANSNAFYVSGTVLSILCKLAHSGLRIATITTLFHRGKTPW